MARKTFVVRALWDEEAKVWVATSDDVPGLATEAATVELLIDKLRVMIPELLEANGVLADADALRSNDVPIELLAQYSGRISLHS